MAVLNWGILAAIAVLEVALAATEEEHLNLKKAMDKCREDFKVKVEDIVAVYETGDVSKIDPCFFACKFRSMGVINDAGFYDTSAAKKNIREFGKEDPTKLDQTVDLCSRVNMEEITDGDKGCERAKLLLSCLIEVNTKFLKD